METSSYQSFEEINSALSSENEASIVLTAENNDQVREFNETQIKTALESLKEEQVLEDYIFVSVPNEEYAKEVLEGEEEPNIDIELLLTDMKMNENNGGEILSEYTYPKTSHVALQTTTTAIPEIKPTTDDITERYEYIDSAHIKTGQNNIQQRDAFMDLIQYAIEGEHAERTDLELGNDVSDKSQKQSTQEENSTPK